MIRDAVSLVSFALNTVQGPRLMDHGALWGGPNVTALVPNQRFAKRDPTYKSSNKKDLVTCCPEYGVSGHS